MNILSYIILIVIAVAFVWAVRIAFFTRTGRKSSSCCTGCSQTTCPHHNQPNRQQPNGHCNK